ncbi:hypothetical protein PoB_002365200 [Plakobranchus ocellatus]|uniref:Uncharacterized protein n=1 Tax=Plakobranchus ocellatus TaxID=259542 RepID=A0AAV3ZRK0_9GAST|nr:hypothetical protein PoB_002365200 [Plakobranchus ocellatus]
MIRSSSQFEGLCKHIREVLGIQRHLRGYNPWQPRSKYMSIQPISGKKNPHLSYRQHANKVGGVVDNRLSYLARQNVCYIGWSMEPGWDKHIREEEKVMREQMKKAGIPVPDGKLIGSSMQERLRVAADSLLSYKEEFRRWKPSGDVPTKEQMARVRKAVVKEPIQTTGFGSCVLGYVNWSPVKGLTYVRPGDKTHTAQGVGVTTLRKTKQKDSKEGNDTKEAISKENDDKKKENGKPDTIGSRGKKNVKGEEQKNRVKFGKTNKYYFDYKKRHLPLGTKAALLDETMKRGPQEQDENALTDEDWSADPSYRVAAVFHWKKMDTSTGYPPLKDKLHKCGYYYGPNSNV